MATKKDVSTLLKRGRLTGVEAARLILTDSVEVDHGREGFLSDKDIREIVNNLSPAEARDYNKWIETYRTLSYYTKDGQIIAWRTVYKLTETGHFIERYWLDFRLRMIQNWMPQIVTEKQYQDMKAKQREELLEDLYCLDNVISRRAYYLASKDIQKACGYDPEGIGIEHPDLYHEAERQVLEQIEAGKLWPVKLSYMASQKDNPKHISYWDVDAEDLSQQEKERLLQTYIPGKELYEAGLPEWIEWIDEFKLDLLEGGKNDSIAVLQKESLDYDVDEQGYYKDRVHPEKLSLLEQMSEHWEKGGKNLKEYIQEIHSQLRIQIRSFLAGKSIVDTCSDLLGVNFGEDVEEGYQRIQAAVDLYNSNIEQANTVAELKFYDGPTLKLPLFHVDKLKPSAPDLRDLRSQVAASLGAKWWIETTNTWIQAQTFKADQTEEGEEAGEEVASAEEA